MAFIQVIDFRTNRIDEGRAAVDEYRASTEGRRTARRGILTKDRDEENHYVNIVFFDSYEEAMKNSEMPETQKLAQTLGGLSEGETRFLNLEIVMDDGT
jgi:hypothetical protein